MVNPGKKPSTHQPLAIWKDLILNKKFLLVNLSTFLALVVGYFVFFKKQDLIFFPHSNNSINFYTDRFDKGNSYIEREIVSDTAIGAEFVLMEGFAYPYIGFEVIPEYKKYLDVSAYNRLSIEATSKNINNLYVYLNIKDNNVKDTTHMLALRKLRSDIDVKDQKQEMSIPLSSFTTQDWWYAKINQPKSDFSKPVFNKVRSINLGTGLNPPLKSRSSFTIYSIRFSRDNTLTIILMGISQLLVLLISFVFFVRKKADKKNVQEPVEINYKATEIKGGTKSKSGYNFLDYIHENYSNSELSLTDIARATGVNQRLISDTISEKFDCNIKTYINQIRIIEAKRLLLESDLKVNEIGYQVGFNSPMNFNRVFKTLAGESPSEFVRKNKA